MAQGERPRSFIAASEPDRCASSTLSPRSLASSTVPSFCVSLAAADVPTEPVQDLIAATNPGDASHGVAFCFLLRLLLFAINLAQTA
jgi:hypothetical protein